MSSETVLSWLPWTAWNERRVWMNLQRKCLNHLYLNASSLNKRVRQPSVITVGYAFFVVAVVVGIRKTLRCGVFLRQRNAGPVVAKNDVIVLMISQNPLSLVIDSINLKAIYFAKLNCQLLMTVYINGPTQSPDLHNSDAINPAFIMCYHAFLLLYWNILSADSVPRHNPHGALSPVACRGLLLTNISNWKTSPRVINRTEYNGVLEKIACRIEI